MKVELRWVSRKTGHQYLDGTVIKDVREQVLQYRFEPKRASCFAILALPIRLSASSTAGVFFVRPCSKIAVRLSSKKYRTR